MVRIKQKHFILGPFDSPMDTKRKKKLIIIIKGRKKKKKHFSQVSWLYFDAIISTHEKLSLYNVNLLVKIRLVINEIFGDMLNQFICCMIRVGIFNKTL